MKVVNNKRAAASDEQQTPNSSSSPPLAAAGLRRSFRLSRKDRRGSSGEGSESGDPEFLTYEEVTRFQQRPNERPRLVVLIGEISSPSPKSIIQQIL